MEQIANLVVLPLDCPALRGRMIPGILNGQIGAVSHKKRHRVFVSVDCCPVQPRRGLECRMNLVRSRQAS
jgi:hypothetical protein